MHSVEDQLRRYGDAFEATSVDDCAVPANAQSSKTPGVFALALVAIVSFAVALGAISTGGSPARDVVRTQEPIVEDLPPPSSIQPAELPTESTIFGNALVMRLPTTWVQTDREAALFGSPSSAVGTFSTSTINWDGPDEGCGAIGAAANAVGPAGSFILVDETPDATPNSDNRPSPLVDETSNRSLEGGCGDLTTKFSVFSVDFWESGRRILVAVGVGPGVTDEDRAQIFQVVDSLSVLPVDDQEPDGTSVVSGTWSRVDTTLSIRESHPRVLAIDDTQFLIVHTQNGATHVAGEIFDATTRSATRIAESQLLWRTNAAVAWTGVELLVVGGASNRERPQVGAAYDPSADTWRVISDPPRTLENKAMHGAWANGELFLLNSQLAYNPTSDSWREISSTPGPDRAFPAISTTPMGILVAGGCDVGIPLCDENPSSYLRDAYLYDTERDVWTDLSPMPLPPSVFSRAEWVRDRVVVFGGWGGPAQSGASASVAELRLETLTWTLLEEPPISARRRSKSTSSADQFIIWGGADSSPLPTGAVYGVDDQEWFLLPQPPAGVADDMHGMAATGEFIYFALSASEPYLLRLGT